MTQTQKDFLALSHGQEWVTFYESFDKLVQDNLSRSSELLRRAMALPEVADREVQQIRTDMEEKLASERGRQRALLSSLQEEITGSYRQVSMLARGVGTVIGDLERLSQRVNEAIASFDVEAVAPAVAEVTAPVAPNGVASAPYAAAPVEPVAPYVPSVAAAPEPAMVEPELPTVAFEESALSQVEELPVDFNAADISAAVDEQQAILDAAEQQLENLEAAIDLSALAEAEAEPEAAAEPAPADAQVADVTAGESAQSGEQRPRPHWLSVTRTGTRA
jgi:hypothetical protein